VIPRNVRAFLANDDNDLAFEVAVPVGKAQGNTSDGPTTDVFDLKKMPDVPISRDWPRCSRTAVTVASTAWASNL